MVRVSRKMWVYRKGSGFSFTRCVFRIWRQKRKVTLMVRLAPRNTYRVTQKIPHSQFRICWFSITEFLNFSISQFLNSAIKDLGDPRRRHDIRHQFFLSDGHLELTSGAGILLLRYKNGITIANYYSGIPIRWRYLHERF